MGESGRRIAERVKYHNGRDYKSNILKHSLKTRYGHVTSSDFWIISKNSNGNKRKRKIPESLLIKKLRPTPNTHYKSVPLKLFNSLRSFEMSYWVLAI